MYEEKYMKRAIELAKQGLGYTSPNPLVGCVVVKDGRIVAEGYHERYGQFHAERNALTRCTEDVRGAEMYVTLEPCCHHGKTPPCTDIIIERGISKVYVANVDNNPKVAGGGIRILRDHGIETQTGFLDEECRKMNEVFFHYMESRMPFVAMKYAMTLDGKIAAYTGDSKWVTGENARAHVQQLRKRYKGIMVGIGTVLADDPMLNCRIEEAANPVRIIIDSALRTPLSSQIVKTAGDIQTIIIGAAGAAAKAELEERKSALEAAGITVILQEPAAGSQDAGAAQPAAEAAQLAAARQPASSQPAQVDIRAALKTLGEMGIDGILVEGGGEIHGSLLSEGLVQKVYAYIAPKLIGGAGAKGPVMGEGIAAMKDALELNDIEITQLGDDLLVTGYPKNSQRNQKCLQEL